MCCINAHTKCTRMVCVRVCARTKRKHCARIIVSFVPLLAPSVSRWTSQSVKESKRERNKPWNARDCKHLRPTAKINSLRFDRSRRRSVLSFRCRFLFMNNIQCLCDSTCERTNFQPQVLNRYEYYDWLISWSYEICFFSKSLIKSF